MVQDLSIGQLAAAAEVNVETVRYYQRRGLLIEPKRPTNGIRRYPDCALQRIRFIKRAQSLGFSLGDVQALLALHEGQQCAAAREIGELKLEEVRQRIKELKALEKTLAELVCRCSSSKERTTCPLIDALSNAEDSSPAPLALSGESAARDCKCAR